MMLPFIPPPFVAVRRAKQSVLVLVLHLPCRDSLGLLTDSKQALFQAIVESDELALALLSFMEGSIRTSWTGTASELQRLLVEGSAVEPSWAGGSATALGSKLRRVATPLREAELLDIEFDRDKARREVHVTRLAGRRWA
jgi:hypothetical protein